VFVTVIGPVVAPAGAVACSWGEEMCVTLVALVPLNLTLEPPLNPSPLIVTTVPAGPLAGLKPVSDRVGVNVVALDPLPAGVNTDTFPTTAPSGTTACSFVPDTNVTDGEFRPPPNLTVAPAA
jgi:hypothetical protein